MIFLEGGAPWVNLGSPAAATAARAASGGLRGGCSGWAGVGVCGWPLGLQKGGATAVETERQRLDRMLNSHTCVRVGFSLGMLCLWELRATVAVARYVRV